MNRTEPPRTIKMNFAQTIRERNALFVSRIDGVFRQLIQWYPACWEGFLELNSTIHQEFEMWGTTEKNKKSVSERAEQNQLNNDIQGVLDRWAGLTRGFARLIATTEKALGERAFALSEDIVNLLADYKLTIGKPAELVENVLSKES